MARINKRSLILLAMLIVATSSQVVRAQQKYPPYPDKWGYDSGTRGIGYVCEAQSGEIYLVPSRFFNDQPKTRLRGLFGGAFVEFEPKMVESAVRQNVPLGNLGKMACQSDSGRFAANLRLPGGQIVERKCSWCGYPSFDVGLELRDPAQKVIARKSFLYLLDKPRKKYLPAPRVSEDVAGDVTVRVLPLTPKLVPLADDSFVVYVGFAVVRFDSAFKTRMPLNQRNTFVVDTSLIETIYREQESVHSRGSLEWHQGVLDAVAQMLRI